MPLNNINTISSANPTPRVAPSPQAATARPTLHAAVVDLLEDPITCKPMYNPVLLDDGRIYDLKTVETMRRQDPQQRWISPFTREVMSRPKPIPQLQAVAQAVYGAQIDAQRIRRRRLAALTPPAMPKVVPFELDEMSLKEADHAVRYLRQFRDSGMDLARVDAGLLVAGGVVTQLKIAEVIVELLKQHGCLDPQSLHVLPKVTASKVELALKNRVAAWYTGSGYLTAAQRTKALSCVKLAIAETARVAELKHAFVRADDRIARAQSLQLDVALPALKQRQSELMAQTLKLPSAIGAAP